MSDFQLTREQIEAERFRQNILVPLVDHLKQQLTKRGDRMNIFERQVRDLARENERLRRENNRLRSLVPQEHRTAALTPEPT